LGEGEAGAKRNVVGRMNVRRAHRTFSERQRRSSRAAVPIARGRDDGSGGRGRGGSSIARLAGRSGGRTFSFALALAMASASSIASETVTGACALGAPGATTSSRSRWRARSSCRRAMRSRRGTSGSSSAGSGLDGVIVASMARGACARGVDESTPETGPRRRSGRGGRESPIARNPRRDGREAPRLAAPRPGGARTEKEIRDAGFFPPGIAPFGPARRARSASGVPACARPRARAHCRSLLPWRARVEKGRGRARGGEVRDSRSESI